MSEDKMDGPLDHLPRSMPPWYTGPALTECGRLVADVKSVSTSDELKTRIATVGKKRAAFSICMTCAETVGRWGTWEQRPDAVVERWVRGAAWRGASIDGLTPNTDRMRRELLALAALVNEHREEFEGLVAAFEATTDLAQARRRARMRTVRP